MLWLMLHLDNLNLPRKMLPFVVHFINGIFSVYLQHFTEVLQVQILYIIHPVNIYC